MLSLRDMNAKDLNRPNPRMHRRSQAGRTHMIRCAERRSECTELQRLDAAPEPGEQRTRFAHMGDEDPHSGDDWRPRPGARWNSGP